MSFLVTSVALVVRSMPDLVGMVMFLAVVLMMVLVLIAVFLTQADFITMLLCEEVVVIRTASRIRELSAASRPRVKIPSRNDLETLATDRIQRTGGRRFDR